MSGFDIVMVSGASLNAKLRPGPVWAPSSVDDGFQPRPTAETVIILKTDISNPCTVHSSGIGSACCVYVVL